MKINIDTSLLDTSHLKSSLKNRSLRSGAITLASQFALLILRVGSIAILARLLSPNDFGLITMVVSVTAFADLFRDLGLSTATIQRRVITIKQINNLFWINVIAGIFIMLIVITLSPLLASFYGESRLSNITLLLSVNFLLGGLSVQHQALLKRQMKFGYIAITEVVSVILSIATAITLASYWRNTTNSYLALVFMSISRNLFFLIGTWITCPWRPGKFSFRQGTHSMLKFGSEITGFNIINYFARNADNIILGKYCGSGALALYSKAYQFLLLPINQIRTPLVNVAIPALSSLQNDEKRFQSYFSNITAILAFITMPLMVYIAVYPDYVVLCMLGQQWVESIPIFFTFALLGIIQPISGMCGLVLITTGKTGRYFVFGALNGLFIVTSFIYGIRWGALGVAISYSVASYILFLPTCWFCFNGSFMTTKIFLRSIVYPAISSIIMGFALVILRFYSEFHIPTCLAIPIFALLGGTVYLGMFLVTKTGRQLIKTKLSYINTLFQKQP